MKVLGGMWGKASSWSTSEEILKGGGGVRLGSEDEGQSLLWG